MKSCADMTRIPCRRHGSYRDQSEKSFPASAQFSFLMSVMMICTASGVQPSARQVPSVSSFASFRRCSVVRPSNIWTLIIGMTVSPLSVLVVVDRYVARVVGDTRHPGVDLRKVVEIEAAFARDMRVGIERDVGEAVLVRDEILMAGEMLLHDAECRVAFLHAPGQLHLLQRTQLGQEVLPEA